MITLELIKLIKLRKREIESVKESIEHWEKDIIVPMEQKGYSIDHYKYFTLNGSCKGKVPMFGKDCQMCKDFADSVDGECFHCPYYKFYKCKCTENHWTVFKNYPTLKNAKQMRDALKTILTHLEGI